LEGVCEGRNSKVGGKGNPTLQRALEKTTKRYFCVAGGKNLHRRGGVRHGEKTGRTKRRKSVQQRGLGKN